MRGNDPKNFEENYCRVPVVLKDGRSYSQIGTPGWFSIILGLMGMVIFASLIAFLIYGWLDPDENISLKFLIFGVSFFGAWFISAVFFFIFGLSILRSSLKARAGRNESPGNPSLWDFSWDSQGISGNQKRKLLIELVLFIPVAFIFGFLVVLLFSSKSAFDAIIMIIISCFFLVIIIYQLKNSIPRIRQIKKYGESYLVFQNFPFIIGKNFSVIFKNLPLKNNLDRLTVNLRYIEEKYFNWFAIYCHQHYLDQKILTAKDFNQNGDLQVDWNLPDDRNMPTHLSHRPAKYWELEVKAEMPEGNYQEWFLLPVYPNIQENETSSLNFGRDNQVDNPDTVNKPQKQVIHLKNRKSYSQFAGPPWVHIIWGIAGIGLFGYLFLELLIPMLGPPINISLGGAAILLFIIGGFFAGIDLIIKGASVILRKKKTFEQKKLEIERPWLWDFPGNSLGIDGLRFRNYFLAEFNGLLMIFALSVVILCVIFPIETAVGFVIAMGFLSFWFWRMFQTGKNDILGLIQYFIYGKGNLLFEGFPFYLGNSIAVKVKGLPDKKRIKNIFLELRLIHEEYLGVAKVNCYQVFFDQKKLSIQDLDSKGDLPIEWSLPDNPEFTTNLSERPARYWELEVKAETSGIDYHERFLLPVYAKP